MSDFGFWELALILFVALLVVGPDRLPALAATLGRWVGRARSIAAQFKADFMNETHADDLKSIMGKTRDAFDSAQQSISETGAEVNRTLRNTDPLVQSIEDQIESGRFAADTGGDTDTNDTADAARTANTTPGAAATAAAANTTPGARHAGAAQTARTGDSAADTTPAAEHKNTAPQHTHPAAEHNPPAPQHETDARRQDPPVRRD